MSSETCSSSLGGVTDDLSRFGSVLEGPLGKFFCTREEVNGLANVEAVICAKVRRWQRQQEWWDARIEDEKEQNAGWFFGPVRHFQRLGHSSHTELHVKAQWGILDEGNFTDDILYFSEQELVEAITDSQERGQGQNSFCTSKLVFLGRESPLLDCPGKWDVDLEDDQRSSHDLRLSGQKQIRGITLESESWNPAVVSESKLTSRDHLTCSPKSVAELSSASSSSFGGGQGDGYTNWFWSPKCGSKAVTSRPTDLCDDPAVPVADNPDFCSISCTGDEYEAQPDTPTGCETPSLCLSRKRARRKKTSDNFTSQTHGEEFMFELVSIRKRQFRRSKSKDRDSVQKAAGGDVSMPHLTTSANMERTMEKRTTLESLDMDKEKISDQERIVEENVDGSSASQRDDSKKSKECSKMASNLYQTAVESQLDLSNHASMDPMMKSETMIRARQVRRRGSKIVGTRLRQKQDSARTCVQSGEVASSPEELHSNPGAPHACQVSASTSQVECFDCKGSLSSGQVVCCSYKNCCKAYHFSCTQYHEGFCWRRNDKLVCPHHVCFVCHRVRSSILWRCEMCPIAFHQNCCPSLQHTRFSSPGPGVAVCWRHSAHWKLRQRHKQPTNDMKELFNRLPIPDEVEAFQITSRFWKEVMENDKEPPPYTHIRRNVFLIKKKRDDFDDGVSCSCHIDDTQVCGEDCECRVQSMSCSKSCECRDKCTNKPFRKERRVKVVKTEHCGWGAEACEAIERGEFIIEYTGEVIDDATCEKRLWEMKGRSVHNFYMCEIAKDFIIDATYKGNPSRYLNHSCQPNCKLEKWRVDGETRVGVFALIDIQVGEPLTYNYKFIDYGMKVICRCGAANCRGAIGEKFGSSTMKSKAGSEPLTVWGARKKRSCLQNRFQNHIRYAVSHQNYRKPARAS